MPEPKGNAGDGGSSNENRSNENGGGSSDGGDQKPAVDLTKLSADELAGVFENPNLYKHDRFKDLAKANQELKKLQEEKSKEETKQLEEQKKFEELANKRASEVEEANRKIQDLTITGALRDQLYSAGVAHLDDALKLADRSDITIGDDGQVSGVKEVVESLKKDKAYLFDKSSSGKSIGTPEGGGSGDTEGKVVFKRSQLRDRSFYLANEKKIAEAEKAGTLVIEDDI